MPSLAEINRQPPAMLGCFTLGELVIHYRRANDHDDTFTFHAVTHDDIKVRFTERDEAMILKGICAMLQDERQNESLWLKDRAKRNTEKPEFARE